MDEPQEYNTAIHENCLETFRESLDDNYELFVDDVRELEEDNPELFEDDSELIYWYVLFTPLGDYMGTEGPMDSQYFTGHGPSSGWFAAVPVWQELSLSGLICAVNEALDHYFY